MLFAAQHHWQWCTLMSNDQVIGDFAADFSAANGVAAVQKNEHSEHANEVQQCDKTLSNNAKYKAKLTKAASRSIDYPGELLISISRPEHCRITSCWQSQGYKESVRFFSQRYTCDI